LEDAVHIAKQLKGTGIQVEVTGDDRIIVGNGLLEEPLLEPQRLRPISEKGRPGSLPN
jgi:hypothetical protein